MFEPRIYKKNGMEAFRLAGSDGSEFFYEGAIDCDEKELYKDSLGRLYYLVTSGVSGPAKYYVELDPQVQQIPTAGEIRRESAISRLVNTSPRPETSLPDDIFVRQEMPLETLQETSLDVPPENPLENAPVSEPEPIEKAADEPLPSPLPATEEAEVMKPEASDAIHAIFSPKVDTSQPPAEPEKKDAATDNAAPVKDTQKKRSLKWPAVIAVVIILVAACAIGVYVVRPHAYDGLRSSLYAQPSVTPQPTAVPTEEPTPTPVPTPTPEPANTIPTPEFSALIDGNSPVVQEFAGNHTGSGPAGNAFDKTCDLFSYVNGQWKNSGNYTQPRKASEIAVNLEGTSRDYTILMCALIQSLGVESRAVFSYNGDDLRYYPEVLASNTSAGYQSALQELQKRYGTSTAQGHSDDNGYWISLDMGSSPGIRPSNATAEYTLFHGLISPLNLKA